MYVGYTALIPANAPLLKGNRPSPFVVVPSANIQNGCQVSLRTSIASWRSMICLTTPSRSSLEPALFKNKDYKPPHSAPIRGACCNSAFGVNPGHNGLVIRFRISMKPVWLHTMTDGLPGPLYGIRLLAA